MQRLSILFVFIFFSSITDAFNSNISYSFKQISIDDGLSQSTVTAILEDNMGDIWIGTKNGLNRFNQYELINYYFEDNDDLNAYGQINFIAEDSILNVWVGTDKGLLIYNRKDNHFQTVRYNDQPFPTYSCKLNNDGIMFGGDGKIYSYNYDTAIIDTLDLDVPAIPINSIVKWADNKIIIGSRYDGVYVYDIQNKVLSEFNLFNKDILSIYVDHLQQLWISSYDEGVYCYSKQGELVLTLNSRNSLLDNNIILDIVERNGKIWFATDGSGIFIYDPSTQALENLKEEPGNSFSISDNSILKLYKDLEDNIWAGSIRSGIFRIKEVYINTYRKVPININYGLSNDAVISLFEEENGTLWIGTDGGGINAFYPDKKEIHHFSKYYGLNVVSITEFDEKNLLLSIFGKGLFKFNKQTCQLLPFTLIDEDTNKRECLTGSSVYVDFISDNKILILGKSIYIYDIACNSFSTITNIDSYYQHLLQKASTRSNTAYLFGIRHLLRLNCNKKEAEVLYDSNGKFIIKTAVYDGGNFIWIGSSDGLYKFDISTYTIEKINTVLFSNISTLYNDDERLWIGAHNMLFCYLKQDKRFIILNESDGAYPNEYFPMNLYYSNSNTLYLGGNTGLACINKNIIFDSDILPNVQLTSINVDGVSKFNEINTETGNELIIPWSTNSIEIKVGSRDFDILRKKVFRYEIIGLNKKYIETYNNVLNLASLSPGEYNILVSCMSSSGVWTTPKSILKISVVPPIWKRGWFILLIITVIICTAILIVLLIIRKNKNQLKWKLREREKEVNDEKIRFLINISHELRTPLTLIYAPLKRIIDKHTIEDSQLNNELLGILNNAKKMKDLINMVLDLRRMEVGQATIDIRLTQLHTWIKEVAKDFSIEFAAKNISVGFCFDNQVDTIGLDKNKSSIIFSNLLMNSLKYSVSDSEILIYTQLLSDQNMVRIGVKDSGKGLKGVDVSQLFNRFYRAHIDESGSGIGLAYSKSLVEMQGGRIGANDNYPEKGATFYFDLPIVNQESVFKCESQPYINEMFHSLERDENLRLEEITELKQYSVLVVDDSLDMKQFLETNLKTYFSTVYSASDGEEAMKMIIEYSPDIIVSDVMMPKVSGFELCKWLKSDLKISHIPIVLLTARVDDESNITGYKLGADMYIPKPFDLSLLINALYSVLNNREKIKDRFKSDILLPTIQETTNSSVDELFMNKLNELILANLENQDLDVQYIAQAIAMSRSSLYNKLKALTGMGVNDYINKFKIERALYLLQNTNLSITEISEQAGFSYQRYFSSVFKQIHGITPSQYRSKIKNIDDK